MIRNTTEQDVIKPKSKKRGTWVKGALGLSALIASLSWGGHLLSQPQNSIAASGVQTAMVERGSLTREINTRGKIIAANAPMVYATSEGLVELFAQPGDQVEQNQLLIRIDSPELTSQYDQAKAELERLQMSLEGERLDARRQQLELKRRLDQAQVTLEAAEREHRRANEAIKQSLISDIDFEQAKDEFASAKLDFSHAKEEVELARDTLEFEERSLRLQLQQQQLKLAELKRKVDKLNVTAPISGMVGNTLVDNRQQVSRNQALMSVVSLKDYQAELEVPEIYADELGLAMPVTLEVAGTTLTGQIGGISPEVLNNQVKVRVRFPFEANLGLRQNQRLNAQIHLQRLENVIKIRRGAFVQSGGGRFGYRINDNLATKIPLDLGASSLTHIQIVSGAKPGDTLIISDLAPMQQQDQLLIND